MTAPNPFAAAIIQLRIFAGIKPVREHEFLSISYGDSPKVPVHQKDIHAAIRVLEAAGRLTAEDKTWLEHRVEQAIAEYNPIIDGMTCPGRARKDRFRALLSALPMLPEGDAALPDKEKP